MAVSGQYASKHKNCSLSLNSRNLHCCLLGYKLMCVFIYQCTRLRKPACCCWCKHRMLPWCWGISNSLNNSLKLTIMSSLLRSSPSAAQSQTQTRFIFSLQIGKWKISPVYSAMDVDVMEDAVEPLSQSLSVVRLELRLRPGNDSTDSPLKTRSHIKAYWLCWRSVEWNDN